MGEMAHLVQCRGMHPSAPSLCTTHPSRDIQQTGNYRHTMIGTLALDGWMGWHIWYSVEVSPSTLLTVAHPVNGLWRASNYTHVMFDTLIGTEILTIRSDWHRQPVNC